MLVGAVKETYPGEWRVALTPHVVPMLTKLGVEVAIEAGAGERASFPDTQYQAKGAKIFATRAEVFERADVVCQVRTIGANERAGAADLPLMRQGQVVVGLANPLVAGEAIALCAARGVKLFALEALPRITRAQAMDVLSSQATVSGYKAVLLAASHLPRMFPMLMTAAGTITAAKVLIIGAGVAGLQAIATARKLGGVVTAFDVRPAVKEQVQSLGAKFLEVALETKSAEAATGYAKAMDEEFYRKQQELMSGAVAQSDVVITTAAVPGKQSPVLVTAAMVARMAPGSVIVDLAAERGGNCALTRADETVVQHGVTILGPTNLPATVPHDASLLYARNMAEFVKHIVKDGKIVLDMNDEITKQTLVCGA